MLGAYKALQRHAGQGRLRCPVEVQEELQRGWVLYDGPPCCRHLHTAIWLVRICSALNRAALLHLGS